MCPNELVGAIKMAEAPVYLELATSLLSERREEPGEGGGMTG
jgi:hypothetical protein